MFFKFNFNTILIIILVGWNILLIKKIGQLENQLIPMDNLGISLLCSVFCLTLISTLMINCCKKLCS